MTHLEEIERLGALQFSTAEICLILGLGLMGAEQLTAMRRGQLKAEAEVRQAILTLAKQGSSPAQHEFTVLVAERRKATQAEGHEALDDVGDPIDHTRRRPGRSHSKKRPAGD